MIKNKNIFVLGVLLLTLVLTGCASQATPIVEAPTATTHAYPPPLNDPEEVAASLTSTPEEAPTAPEKEPPDPEPTEAIAAEPEVDNCVECHTNQQALIDTTDAVEEIETENEGEG